MMWAIPAARAALSLLQSEKQRKADKKQRGLAAETAKYSPWTGLSSEMPMERPDALMSAGQAGVSGLAVAQGIDKFQSDMALRDAMLQDYKLRSSLAGPQVSPEFMQYQGRDLPDSGRYSYYV